MIACAQLSLLTAFVDDDRVQVENAAVLHVRLRDRDPSPTRVSWTKDCTSSSSTHAHHRTLVYIESRFCALIFAFKQAWLLLMLLLAPGTNRSC